MAHVLNETSVLGPRLLECTEAVLAVENRSASAIFGSTDERKLKSSMTLFETLAGPGSAFAAMSTLLSVRYRPPAFPALVSW